MSPAAERPAFLELGDNAFDPKKVGLVQPDSIAAVSGSNYSGKGTFILDTQISGSSNLGHEFSAVPGTEKNAQERAKWPKGVIGPLLDDAEKLALIEYLKTL